MTCSYERQCIVCHAWAEVDDWLFVLSDGRCLCLACLDRVRAHGGLRLPLRVVRDIEGVLSGAG